METKFLPLFAVIVLFLMNCQHKTDQVLQPEFQHYKYKYSVEQLHERFSASMMAEAKKDMADDLILAEKISDTLDIIGKLPAIY